jgi:hypothetical protein
MTDGHSGDASDREERLRRLAERRQPRETRTRATQTAARLRPSKAPVARILLSGGSTAAVLALAGTMAITEAPASQVVAEPVPIIAATTSTTPPPIKIIKVIYRPVVVPAASAPTQVSRVVPSARPSPVPAPVYTPAPAPVPAVAPPRNAAPATTVTTTRAT